MPSLSRGSRLVEWVSQIQNYNTGQDVVRVKMCVFRGEIPLCYRKGTKKSLFKVSFEVRTLKIIKIIRITFY